jgi:hypothetical protein
MEISYPEMNPFFMMDAFLSSSTNLEFISSTGRNIRSIFGKFFTSQNFRGGGRKKVYIGIYCVSGSARIGRGLGACSPG